MPNIGKVPTREEIELRAYEIYLERAGKKEMRLTIGLLPKRNYPNQDTEDNPTL